MKEWRKVVKYVNNPSNEPDMHSTLNPHTFIIQELQSQSPIPNYEMILVIEFPTLINCQDKGQLVQFIGKILSDLRHLWHHNMTHRNHWLPE